MTSNIVLAMFINLKDIQQNVLGGVANGQGRFPIDSPGFAKNLLLDYARFACSSPKIHSHIATKTVTDFNKFALKLVVRLMTLDHRLRIYNKKIIQYNLHPN